MESIQRAKKYDIKCSICHSIMKTRNNDPREIPLAIRTAKPAICETCLEEMLMMSEVVYSLNVDVSSFEEFFKQTEESKEEKMHDSLCEVDSSNVISKYLEISKKVKEDVKCQDKTVDKIITALIKRETDPQVGGEHILIVGNSGVGKTFFLSKIAENADVPISFEDATAYTEEGYIGKSVREMLLNLYIASGSNLEKTEKGIIVIDEGDKKATPNSSTGRDVSGVIVLKSLLTMLDGKKVKVDLDIRSNKSIEIDTTNILFILTGAFEGLNNIREKRLKQKTAIGFNSYEVKEFDFKEYIPQDIIEYGIPREFAGRCPIIAEMNSLGEKELFVILKESNSSAIKREEKRLRKFGVTLIYSDEILLEFASRANKLGVGVRALKSVILKALEEVWNKTVYEHELFKGKNIQLLPGITEDNSKYLIS